MKLMWKQDSVTTDTEKTVIGEEIENTLADEPDISNYLVN